MDHPEPISKRPTDIPQCRKGFTLDEARVFVDQIMDVFRSLEDMSDLRSMYETGKQLSRAYFDCHAYRSELAQHLTVREYPAFASKMMKKLNNLGVFKNDDIWFSSFYFYNTTWNFSDTWPDFATALAVAGLPNLLNLNIGHQPYLENLNSKNVYYLIKATLSIFHNIARVPGNSHHFASDSVRQALVHLAQREEEFLRCVSTLCLSHIINESELHLLTDGSGAAGNVDLLRMLVGYISTARASEKRRCHGYQVIDLLSALCALSVHDPIKQTFVTAAPGSSGLSTITSGGVTGGSTTTDHGPNCIGLLKDLVEIALLAAPSAVALREAEEAIKALWNLSFDSISSSASTQAQLKSWFSEVLSNPTSTTQLSRSMIRAMEATHWKLSHGTLSTPRDESIEMGQILFSFAPSNRVFVNRIVERLREANLPVTSFPLCTESSVPSEATAVGLSMCAANSTTQQQWLDCVEQATVLVVCLSDSYRLSPGCRFELEYYLSLASDSRPRPIVPLILQPKFQPTGWLTRSVTKTAIDFNNKRDIDSSYENLINQLKDIVSEARKRTEAAASLVAAQRHPSSDGKRHPVLAGDTGMMTSSGNPEVLSNHLNASGTSNRAPSVYSVRRDELLPSPSQYTTLTKTAAGIQQPSFVNSKMMPTNAWRHVIRPEVRNWSTSTVANWLKFRSLGHVPSQMAGGIDGVLLSQLAGLRLWAPEYFTQSLHQELNLSFADSLRFLEALDELAPEDETTKPDGDDDAYDSHAVHVNAIDGTISRT